MKIRIAFESANKISFVSLSMFIWGLIHREVLFRDVPSVNSTTLGVVYVNQAFLLLKKLKDKKIQGFKKITKKLKVMEKLEKEQ